MCRENHGNSATRCYDGYQGRPGFQRQIAAQQIIQCKMADTQAAGKLEERNAAPCMSMTWTDASRGRGCGLRHDGFNIGLAPTPFIILTSRNPPATRHLNRKQG